MNSQLSRLLAAFPYLLDKMLQQGVIEPSTPPWASSVILVHKSYGTMQFCVDYRKLNIITLKDSYPLARVEDLMDSLSNACWFTIVGHISETHGAGPDWSQLGDIPAYIDDIMLFGHSWEKHLQSLPVVLTRLQEAHLKRHP